MARTDLFVGMRPLYVDSATRFEADILPPGLAPDGRERRESALGAVGAYYTRDNIFTPTRGEQIKASAMFFDESLDSDREYQRYTAGGVGFRCLVARLLGLHVGIDVAKGPEEWATREVFVGSW